MAFISYYSIIQKYGKCKTQSYGYCIISECHSYNLIQC